MYVFVQYVWYMCGLCGCQKKASGSVELKSQMLVSSHVVLGITPHSSERAAVLFPAAPHAFFWRGRVQGMGIMMSHPQKRLDRLVSGGFDALF